VSLLKQFNFARGKMLIINADPAVTEKNYKDLKWSDLVQRRSVL